MAITKKKVIDAIKAEAERFNNVVRKMGVNEPYTLYRYEALIAKKELAEELLGENIIVRIEPMYKKEEK